MRTLLPQKEMLAPVDFVGGMKKVSGELVVLCGKKVSEVF